MYPPPLALMVQEESKAELHHHWIFTITTDSFLFSLYPLFYSNSITFHGVNQKTNGIPIFFHFRFGCFGFPSSPQNVWTPFPSLPVGWPHSVTYMSLHVRTSLETYFYDMNQILRTMLDNMDTIVSIFRLNRYFFDGGFGFSWRSLVLCN